ncbi:hypothetical protein [Zarconia navalis]|nr:hypothetical protein [Zarconia navalis]
MLRGHRGRHYFPALRSLSCIDLLRLRGVNGGFDRQQPIEICR